MVKSQIRTMGSPLFKPAIFGAVMAIAMSVFWTFGIHNFHVQADSSLTLDATAGDSFAVLHWSLSGVEEFDGFSIERRVAQGGTFAEIANVNSGAGNKYLDTDVENGTKYVYRIEVQPDTLGISDVESITPSASSPVTLPSLDAPRIDAVVSNGRLVRFVNVTWTHMDFANGSDQSYDFHREGTSTIFGVSGSSLPTGERVFKYSVNHEEGQTYRYGIRMNLVGEDDVTYSTSVSWGSVVVPVLTPTDLSASQSNGQVDLKWYAADDVQGYRIYRRQIGHDSELQELVSTTDSTDTQYTDTDVSHGSTYKYAVAAVRLGDASYKSNTVQIAKTTELPPTPVGLEAVAHEDGSIVLSWDQSDDSTVTGYQVFRGRPRNVVPATVSGTDATYKVADVSGIEVTAYTDTQEVFDWPHVYRVKAVNVAGESAPSNRVDIVNVPFNPNFYQITSEYTDNGWALRLHWTHYERSNDVSGFQIWRRSSNDGESALTVYVQDTGDTQKKYLDTNVTPGWRYKYMVKAINSGGTSSPTTVMNRLVPRAVGSPNNVTASAEDEGTVRLTWDAPSYGNVTGYRILRRVTHISGNERVHVSDTGNTTTSYIDTDTTANYIHIYRVVALDSSQTVPSSLPSSYVYEYPLEPDAGN